MNTVVALIKLAACAVNETVPDEDLIAELRSRDDLMKALLLFSKEHQMTALTAYALQSGGIHNAEFERYRRQAAFFECTLDMDREMILGGMEKAGIWYMPMKGVILKELYPQPGMRQMADNDILFDADKAEKLKSIMESLGFTTELFDKNHHDVYIKAPISTFEMHRMLFMHLEAYEKFYLYYDDIKSRLIKDEDSSYGYHFSDEDFYIYMIAHGYKHQSWRGTGLRTLLDLYVYLKKYKNTLDWSYIHQELDKLGLAETEEENRNLALKVFSDVRPGENRDLSEKEIRLLNDFTEYGAYGSLDHIKKVIMNGLGRPHYLWRRIFLTMEEVEEYYPYFYKHKILLPLLPFYRLIVRGNSAKREIRMFFKVKK